MRGGQGCEGHRDKGELPDRRADADPHQRAIAAARAPERDRRLRQREREREDQREMSGLDDHGSALREFPSPSLRGGGRGWGALRFRKPLGLASTTPESPTPGPSP